MERKIVRIAAILGMLAIILGAFGAHALKKVLTVEQLVTFETGVKYQMYHALLLLLVGLSAQVSDVAKKRIFYFVVTGVLFFSGSIYLLATNDLTSFDFKKIGFITPLGGLLLIVGWMCLFIDFLKKKS
jgi:uncharacterized membrane protein YgdD (TMEM256/DUF423 family)